MRESVRDWKLHGIVLLLVIVGELIGSRKIDLGFGVLALFPMLYVLILGGVISWPSFRWLTEGQMKKAATILGIAFMLFVAKLGTMLGPSLLKIFDAGWSLAFQEVGHFIGTIILGLPIALWLGMGRESIGATFSIDREPNLAIISEKYGADSPEGRGALGVYVCGTLFGAIYLALLAGFLGSMGFLHPISLAMGAGVGSGSMMAAASGALAVVFPDYEKDIAVFAGAANLLTTILGTYICIFFSLPVTVKLYKWLAPIIGKNPPAAKEEERSA
ncbi:DUF3100 domain-containing protein [Brevibacillus composti]|uniref:DUF3100 domain-containing protein n=1 Tax=Brevibacillus composti TaxID=2796470 RepID=A0A7T5EHG8_9BACL|nr:DUF3100 domain-containing protein [Brevibacillus composti]QQE72709.1 DUF3100 domain-containing protein [Brevibacillus composti]QUO39787.1 DUF3100 domain-containing protein [Brevibacillus composti]